MVFTIGDQIKCILFILEQELTPEEIAKECNLTFICPEPVTPRQVSRWLRLHPQDFHTKEDGGHLKVKLRLQLPVTGGELEFNFDHKRPGRRGKRATGGKK